MSLLVCAAHPDDEVLGCGGTIARRADEGEDVHVAIFGEGITSRAEERGKADEAQLQQLKKHAEKAASVLGAHPPKLYEFPDNRFDTVPLLEIVKEVEALIDDVQPDTILTHHQGDLNIDHTRLRRAVVTATRPMADSSIDQILSFEVPSSSEWTFRSGDQAFQPTTYVDITETLDRKLEAMAVYETETRDPPHPRSLASLEALATWRGSNVGYEAAEAFQPVRILE